MHVVFQRVYGPSDMHMFIVMQRLALLIEQRPSRASTLPKLGQDLFLFTLFFTLVRGVKGFGPQALYRASEMCCL